MSNDEIKPLTTFAPPPLSAAISIAAIAGLAVYYFPEFDHPDPTIFTNRVFPDIVSVPILISLRAVFACIGFLGFSMAWMWPPVTVSVPYRPSSRCPRIPFILTPWRKQLPFTCWSWNILGISFALSTYISYQVHHDQQVPPWLLRLALLLWEIAAPMTLLIGAVVKYVLWPASIQHNGHGNVFLTPRALLQHNANVIMAVTEVALLGGLPVHFSHASISVLYGCTYVLFLWLFQLQWHGKGPAFIYFFMDTTLGNQHTIALYVLFSVFMVFHGLFCGVESILHMVGNNLLGHAAFAVVLCASVCRFRD